MYWTNLRLGFSDSKIEAQVPASSESTVTTTVSREHTCYCTHVVLLYGTGTHRTRTCSVIVHPTRMFKTHSIHSDTIQRNPSRTHTHGYHRVITLLHGRQCVLPLHGHCSSVHSHCTTTRPVTQPP